MEQLLLQTQQSQSPDIPTISRTENMPSDKQNKQNSSNSKKNSRAEQRDSLSKIFKMRENSDPSGACHRNDNKSLPKLVQNQDALQKINHQILQRTYLNQKNEQIFSKNPLVNYTFNQIELNSNSPLKRSVYQKSSNTQYRNSMVNYQRVTQNINYKPINTINNSELVDQTGKSKEDELESLFNENFTQNCQKLDNSRLKQQEIESLNYLKRASFKKPQFKLNMSYQKRVMENRQINQQKNQSNDTKQMSSVLNIQPLQNAYKNFETNGEDSLSNTSEILISKVDQRNKDELYQLIKKKYQNASFQQYLQQSNQNYEPSEQDINYQSNNTKLNFRTSSNSRQGTSNNQNYKDNYLPKRQPFSIQPKKFNGKDTSYLENDIIGSNLNQFERSLLAEKEQSILKRTILDSQLNTPPPVNQKQQQLNISSQNKNGKIILHINKSSNKIVGSITPTENQSHHSLDQNSQSKINQVEISKMNNCLDNFNTNDISINGTIKLNRKFSSLNNLDFNTDQMNDLDEGASQQISTDVALTNSGKLSQSTEKQKVANIRLENQSKLDENQENFTNVLSEKADNQSVQENSNYEQLNEQKQSIEAIQRDVKDNLNLEIDEQELITQASQNHKQFSSPIKSLTQQTPREKKIVQIQLERLHFQSQSSQDASKNVQIGDQRQFIRTKRSNQSQLTERKNSKSQSYNIASQSNKIKSSNNIDNSSDGKSSKSPSKKPIKQKAFKQPPEVSSKCWSVFNSDTNEFIFGKSHNFQVEIASLTKIMTCYVTIKFLEENQLDIKNVFIEVSKAATKTIGTTANLEKGDFVSTYELLYGLMLPSGNDAAVVLSEGVGYLLYCQQSKLSFTNDNTSSGVPGDQKIYVNYKCKSEAGGLNQCMNIFIKEMNKQAQKVGLERTNYACVHGLSNKYNTSTAKDVGLLSCIVMKHPLIQKVVNTKEYETVDVLDQEKSNQDQYEWENTNQMLEKKGYDGVKTGVTETAGPCLSSSYKCKRNGKQVGLICVLLNCKSMDHRWPETKQLIKWALKSYFPKEKKQSEADGSSSYSPSPPPKQK
ncbi:D-alanyl-D-alanine carboxypeptidase family protein (macronuclear) [Tetrahymena thermophila SB210]|uniref:D-alanyl-D-alanine carboxypeptidase family protein n=1 Tax=Tetrahymena thermophila (strain SB210) TaxID=312017 RepID=Q245D5_TETTS|nr:D-alanyl-D-alanine carboxypeptidase family protein [Tetrahymena thermophila SB210]EAS03429.2 D-alanyl-D-alanine carboxypeptidase family protein [Tetrahymena thermophila SB210]|eukprot:XP_001023674.2 D-alanyl-D-alanine carboxypeptidase family protein [Tetrahymena thermophila SB210]